VWDTIAIIPWPMLIFNPLVRARQDDYGNLYVSVGDGASGETPGRHIPPAAAHTFMGKILRITPISIWAPKTSSGA